MTETETPKELDAITTHVLNYRPDDKGLAAEKMKEKLKNEPPPNEKTGTIYISPKNKAGKEMRNQVRGQVGDQVRNQAADQVRVQVWGQVRGQVSNQVWRQVWGQMLIPLRNHLQEQNRNN